MTERQPNVTPLHPKPSPDESQSVVVPAERLLFRVGKWAAAIGGILTLLATIIGVPMWLVGEIDGVEAAVKADTKEQIEAHTKHPHPSAVPREVYELHVEAQEKANEEAKGERKEILQRLNTLGTKTYRSPERWQKAVKEVKDDNP